MSIMLNILRQSKQAVIPKPLTCHDILDRSCSSSSSKEKPSSKRVEEFRKMLREKAPLDRLEEIQGNHPDQEADPLRPWPKNTNPNTGEIGGPRGPEPTRYGDWERKGRVSDF